MTSGAATRSCRTYLFILLPGLRSASNASQESEEIRVEIAYLRLAEFFIRKGEGLAQNPERRKYFDTALRPHWEAERYTMNRYAGLNGLEVCISEWPALTLKASEEQLEIDQGSINNARQKWRRKSRNAVVEEKRAVLELRYIHAPSPVPS
ncbi:hypothetical protein B0H16DRAFT_256491 [Mycena metata]|uniref:Uncharacterized protein n=1 Tax=Mycena metata TaxID=1033252 RepID=A0AAD7JQ15_9AGAR|nr:hypothetical protein B0H16DRAFT_256491 [Mycena metata]